MVNTGTAEAEPYVPAVMPESIKPKVRVLFDLEVMTELLPAKMAVLELVIEKPVSADDVARSQPAYNPIELVLTHVGVFAPLAWRSCPVVPVAVNK